MKPAREPASSRPKPCASLKKPHESCPFAAPCGPRRKKNDLGQISASPSEISRFKPVILAHRGSALPWLVNDRAALRLRRIWCCWPYLIGQHPLSPVFGQKRPGSPGNSYFAQLPPVFGHFMVLSGGLLDYSNRSTWATRTINGAPRVWAEKYIFWAQNTDETATRL